MLHSLSFEDAYETMVLAETAVKSMEPILGECLMEIIHDALQHYARTQALNESDTERDYAALLALAFSMAGYNSLLPEYDVTLELRVNKTSGAGEDA